MKVVRSIAIVAVLLLACMGIAADQTTAATETETKPGDGVLCLWMLTYAASEVGKHCQVKGDPAVQAALEQGVAEMDRYVEVNGKWSTESIEQFKRVQIGAGEGTTRLCTKDGLQLYDVLRSQGAAAIRARVKDMVARPGPPAWGTCV